jgi:tetratricopeptide (TPR) repeat protein
VFAREVDSNETMKAALEGALLYKVDCEKGEGPEIAKKYEVRGYPTFVAVNGDGEVTDRWIGYGGPESWAENVAGVKADRRTIVAKKAAYAEEPTLALARSLANDAATGFDYKAAVGYYETAREMDPENAGHYSEQILMNMAYGVRSGAFTFDEVDAEAQAALAGGQATPEQALQLALMMNSMAKQMGMPEKGITYLTAGLEATEGVTDEKLVQGRRYLEIDHALLVEKDAAKALKIRRAMLPAGWNEDPTELNQFAWWCFENGVNLEEALELAIKGAELAPDDKSRANILDTAAEICNAMGNCDEAIVKIKKAIELDPDNGYFKDQLVRFEKIAEEKKG